MKPNKVKKDAPKAKVTSIKGGMIKKSHANKVPSALSAFKDPERALSLIQKAQEDGNVKMKVNKKKGQSQQVAKNENAASPKPVKSQGPIKAESKEPTANFKVTSKKNKQGGLVKTSNFTVSDSSPLGKAPGTKLKRKAKNASEEENNTSPVKVGQPVKKAKVPFNESLLTLDNTLEQELAPETLLGLQIEKALSPRSEKKKKKQLAKLQAQGKVEVSKPESSPSSSEKRRKRSKRRGKKYGANKEHAPLLEVENVKNALKALFKTAKASDKDLFGEDKFIYLQCNVLKGSEKTKAVLHIPLPHPVLPESPEILFICPDLKGKRNEPDEAVDFYKELLSTKGIDYISEIIPIRRLKMDYSSFEQRKKLADRFDAVTVDGRVSLFARIGKRFAGTKACVASVNMEEKRNLKDEFDKAIKKVAFFSSGNGLSFSIKCGRNGMPMDKVAENIMCISQYLSNDRIIIGNPRNIASVYVKLALSKAFPVYVNTSPPNVVETPAGKVREEEEPVEDEVTTVFGGNVVVYPSGKVKVKKDKKAKKSPESEENQESPKPIEKKANKAETKKQKSKAKEESDEEESDEEEEDDDLSFDIASDYELSDGEKGELSDDEGSDDEEEEEEEEDEDDDEKDEESDADNSDEEVSRVEEESDDDDDEENEEESDDDVSENSDEFEDKIEAAEREYLQEVRDIQDEMSKNKKKLKKMVNDQKAIDNAEKAPQGKKIGKSNIPLKQQPQKNVPIQQKGSPKQNKKNVNKKQGSILKEAAEKIKESNQKLQEKLSGPKKFGKPKEPQKPEGLANRKPFNRQDSKGGSPKQWKGQNKKQGNEPGNFQKKKPGNQGSPQQRNQGSPQQRNQKSKQQQQNGVSSLKNRKFENFNKGNKQNENKPQGEKRFKK